MENQHRKITGYRELSEAEIALMNEIKALGAHLEHLQHRVLDHVEAQLNIASSANNFDEVSRLGRTEPTRWAKIANTHFQEGLMALTRAVAQPTSY